MENENVTEEDILDYLNSEYINELGLQDNIEILGINFSHYHNEHDEEYAYQSLYGNCGLMVFRRKGTKIMSYENWEDTDWDEWYISE